MSRPSNVSKSSLVNSLAKRYDPKALQNQGPVTAKKTPQPQPVCNYSKTPVNLNNTMDTNLEILNQKMDNVLMTQNNVVEKLDNIMQDIGGIERDIEFMKSDTTKTEHVSESSKDKVKMSDIKELFVEMITNLTSINKYAEHQAQKLHGVEQILLGAQNVIHFIMEEMKIKEMFTFVQKKETPLKPVIVGNKIRKEETEIQKQRGEMKGVKKNVKTRDSTRKWKSCLNGKKIKVNKDQINEKKNWRLKGTKSLKKKKPPDSDVSPSPPAPFTHRIVSAKHAQINHFYTVDTSEMLGGGRYGQVHRCAEKNSGLSLAAKIIKVKSHKEKEEVKNEIQVMNQLNHVNLIQLYDAFESRNDIVLVMEYVEGGELFDRIIDEKYNLSEADTIQFIKQILEGIQYMHQMYIVHLDLKPENIMCVSRTAYQVKIIDFGLARRYKPREKLKVHFGTPEFLAPEVVNYDYVSFPTDMWSVGVITFMLLSGLSPFLGEDDNETLNNILACQFDFEGEEFENISEPAKDFITKLLIKEKCWRMSATEALKHLWISDSKLHYRISQQCLGNICPVSDVSGNK
ncbi:myosin light chain kinase family member 4 isoform X4 [Xenopus laevis]|uniref:Myosin light chain kinase family member 4 isoform X4 n=1 Tax=Xenopus laevis TaxID=8355 RepID=A0A8J1KY16_XENLA|nr:myosin light chain kinase family member 4 isoform X4 [Xenopus laevis]